MTEKLEPLGDRVIIKPLETEEVSKGGIILPDTAKEKPQEGEIIAIGPGKIKDDGARIPMEVKVGDKVMFAKYAGTEIKLGEEKLMIMSQSDIMAIKERRSKQKAKEEKPNA
ncbi:MAG: co-chaperone GroES [Dehalococcoides mccartyi]|uniref:co-chaperone GroES n=1 Tax=Dehalococcoides mccartyi TaxID=61435 RepID=UPI002A637543|nr:co-chaperone GroES [Candidatus Omnitrophota bacterium]